MTKWHEGAKWAKYLELYDSYAKNVYPDAKVVDLPSRFGTTRAYLSGNAKNPPVFLMHGANDVSFTWQWLVPKLVQQDRYYVVAVDRIGDIGRSRPHDGLTSNLPNGQDEVVEWILSVKKELGYGENQKISLVGHSYGCLVSTMFTMAHPDQVDRLVWTAPAAVVSAQQIPDLIYMPIFHLLYLITWLLPYKSWKVAFWISFLNSMCPEGTTFDQVAFSDLALLAYSTLPHRFELIAGVPCFWSVAQLKDMASKVSTLLIIGDQETATYPKVSIANARAAGIPTKVLPKATHIIAVGNEEEMATDIAAFLAGQTVNGAFVK